MDRDKISAPRGRHTIFFKVLTGYVATALVVVALAGLVSTLLIRNYILTSNLEDLLARAEAVATALARPDGRVRVLTPKGLREMESMCDAQLIYVDTDMVARQMPVKQKGNILFQPPSAPTTDQADASAGDGAPDTPANNAAIFVRPPAPNGQGMRRMYALYQALFPVPQDEPAAEDEEAALTRINLAGSVDEQLVRSIMGGESATDVRQLQFSQDPVMFAGMPIIDSETGEVSAAVILSRPLTDVGTATWNFLWMLAFAGGAAILCAAVMAWFMSRRLTRPVMALSKIAGRMAEGHYDERFTFAQKDEIGQLGATLNMLSARLDDVIGTLAGEKRKLELILSSIGEGIIAVDQGGRVIHANAAALNLLELRAWDIHPDNPHSLDQQRQLIDMLNRSMRETSRMEITWDTVQGRTIEAIAAPIAEAGFSPIGAVCLVRDVSEAQRLEQMRRDYIANISHELRTPLTGIRGMVEPLMDGMMETDREKDECYRVIYQETVRLEKLIAEMLDLSRLQSGRITIELEPMQPQGLLEAATRRMKARAEEGAVTLEVKTDGDPLTFMGAEDRVLQVLIILTDNALSFTPPGGKVTLFARRAGEGKIALGVEDTGCGIDPIDLPYIWERFYKADRSRMRTSGTGLGLAIAKLVTELMGGEISVATAPGKGSTFTFILDEARGEQ